MVTRWGLSDSMGPLLYDEDDGEVFLGMSAGAKPKHFSNETAQAIDKAGRITFRTRIGRRQSVGGVLYRQGRTEAAARCFCRSAVRKRPLLSMYILPPPFL